MMTSLSSKAGVSTALALTTAGVVVVNPASALPHDESNSATWVRRASSHSTPLPVDFRLARTLEQAAPDLGWTAIEVQRFRQDIASAFNQDMIQAHGPLPDQIGDVLGTDRYVTEAELQTYVVDPPAEFAETEPGIHLVTVSTSAIVSTDGRVVEPGTSHADAQSSPIWDGPWGSEIGPFWHGYTVVDKPGPGEWPDCTGSTKGEMRTRLYMRQLADTSNTFDYWGLHKANVAEITEHAGGFNCNADWVDETYSVYSVYDWQGSTPEYMAQDPDELTGTDCTQTDIELQVSYGAGQGAIKKSFERCDKWDVSGYAEQYATAEYGVSFDNNGSCSDADRVYDFAMVIREDQDNWRPGWSSTIFIDPDQQAVACSGCGG